MSEAPIGVMDDAFVAVLYLLGIVIPRQGSLHSVLFEVAVVCGYCVYGNQTFQSILEARTGEKL
ncbi:MAG: hypothetical protein ACR2N1_06970 [Rubripirellula sp.]